MAITTYQPNQTDLAANLMREKHCVYCAVLFKRRRTEGAATFARRKFCSLQCMGLEKVGRYKAEATYGSGHRRARTKTPKGPCAKCGAPNAIDVHHKNGDWADNELSNLERICRSCHMKEHWARNPQPMSGRGLRRNKFLPRVANAS